MKNSLLYTLICLTLLSCQNKRTNIPNNVSAGAKKTFLTPKKGGSQCSYDNDVATLGIGLVLAPSQFKLYNDSTLSSIFASYDLDKGESKINVCPKFFSPDYGIAHFVCVSKGEGFYKILINYNETKYMPKTKVYVFKSWKNYIIESLGVRRSNSQESNYQISYQPLRKYPSQNTDTISIPKGLEMFCPMDVEGDWLKVNYDCFYNEEDNKHEGESCHDYITKCKNPISGWIRWRNQNKLLVDIMLTD
jgi:hypothetical protein